MDIKAYKEQEARFTEYLEERKLRKTEERFTILKYICDFPGYFNVEILYNALESANFHVSRATLYNTLEVLTDAGLVVRHQTKSQSFIYELRILAESHLHLICTKCGEMAEAKNNLVREKIGQIKTPRFAQEYFLLYIYGICGKCKYRKSKKSK